MLIGALFGRKIKENKNKFKRMQILIYTKLYVSVRFWSPRELLKNKKHTIY